MNESNGPVDDLPHVVAYVDGNCPSYQGSGGYGVVLECRGVRKEIAEGLRGTTNPRMDLMGAIAALKALTERCRVVVRCDSEYVVKGVEQGWAKRWRERGWVKADKTPAANVDLWDELLGLCDEHAVSFEWAKSGSLPELRRCWEIASKVACRGDLETDARTKREAA